MKFLHNTWNKNCKEKIVTTKPFMTLEEFLLLKDPTYKDERSLHSESGGPEYWVGRYEIAKKSYERYGKEGPPAETLMIMMEAGFGGSHGVKRTLKGIYDNDSRFFEMLSRETDYYTGQIKENSYLAIREYWFVVMAHPDDVPNLFFSRF